MPISPLYVKNFAAWDDDPPLETTPILGAYLDNFEDGIWGAYYNTIHQAETASDAAAVFRGAAGQAEDLAQFLKSDDTLLARITSDGAVAVSLDNPNAVAANLRGAVAQAADLTQWERSTGTVLARVTKDGTFSIEPDDTTVVPLTLKGAAAQVGDLLRYTKNDGTVLGRVTKDGALTVELAAAAGIAATLKGAAAQSGDLLQHKKSDGTVLARVTKDGAHSVELFADVSALTLRGAAAGSADLAQFQKSDATVMSAVTSDGSLELGQAGQTGTASLIFRSGIDVTSSSGGVVTVAGTKVGELNEYGDLLMGANQFNLSSANPLSVNNPTWIDWGYFAKSRRWSGSAGWTLFGVGDTPETGIWRAGDSGYPDGPAKGTIADVGLGSLYFATGLAATAGGDLLRWADRGKATGQMNVKLREDGLYVAGVQSTGGDLEFFTFPTQADMVTYAAQGISNANDISDFRHIQVTHNGVVGIFGFIGNPEAAGHNPGDLVVQGDVTPGVTDASQEGYFNWRAYHIGTTVGAAGGASAPPATPKKWAKVKADGVVYVVPLYVAP